MAVVFSANLIAASKKADEAQTIFCCIGVEVLSEVQKNPFRTLTPDRKSAALGPWERSILNFNRVEIGELRNDRCKRALLSSSGRFELLPASAMRFVFQSAQDLESPSLHLKELVNTKAQPIVFVFLQEGIPSDRKPGDRH